MNKKKLKREQLMREKGITKKSKKVPAELPNRFFLTPEKLTELDLLALKMPLMQRRDKNGKLMFNGVDQKTGKPKPLFVNHILELRNIWQKDGQHGVDIYANFFFKLAKEQDAITIEESQRQAETAPGAKIISLGN